MKTLGPEYDEDTLRQALAGDHVHIPKIPRADYSESQVKQLIDIEDKLRAGKGKGYLVWAERNNINAISQTVIFLKEHHIGSSEELEQKIDDLQSACEERKAFIRQAQNRMKEINRQRQAIRDYRRTKEIYTQFKESGWSAKFYQEHRAEIEAHKKAQAVYELHDGKLPTLKELTAEYVALKEQLDAYKPDLAELKSKLTDLKHIRRSWAITSFRAYKKRPARRRTLMRQTGILCGIFSALKHGFLQLFRNNQRDASFRLRPDKDIGFILYAF